MSTDTKTDTKQDGGPRQLTSHVVNAVNEALKISVMDEPGPGGANHLYTIFADEAREPLAGESDPKRNVTVHCTLQFQKGPIAEVGVNGITQETLLAVIEDRLAGFQSGPYACDENAKALDHVRAAQAVLKSRTAARAARGVEGTMKV